MLFWAAPPERMVMPFIGPPIKLYVPSVPASLMPSQTGFAPPSVSMAAFSAAVLIWTRWPATPLIVTAAAAVLAAVQLSVVFTNW